MFVRVVRLAQEMGLVIPDTVAAEGNKRMANVQPRMAMRYFLMIRTEAILKAHIEAPLRRAASR